MRKIVLIATALILVSLLISNCSSTHNVPNPVSAMSAERTCSPGAITYTAVSYASGMVTGIVINSQADYIANYIGWAPAGSPTPTPVPVDFTKNTLVGFRLVWDCGTGAGLTGMTTDYSGIYLNVFRTSSCSLITCNSVFSMSYYYLIDKTTLPIYIQDITQQCDGSYNTGTAYLIN